MVALFMPFGLPVYVTAWQSVPLMNSRDSFSLRPRSLSGLASPFDSLQATRALIRSRPH